MNSSAFGNPAWNFLHQLPWLFPTEVLSLEDSIVIIRFLRAIIRMLPCMYCRNSGELFEKELGLLDSVSYDLGGFKIVTRSRVAKYIYEFHNRVNVKLEKPLFGVSWKDSVKPRSDWKLSFWALMFAICWNFPESDPSDDMITKYFIFFANLLPRTLKYTDVGKDYSKCLKTMPFSKNILNNRLLICKWIYNTRCMCMDSCGSEEWNFEDTDTLMEAFRARTQTCSMNRPSSKEEALSKKSCQ